MNDPGRLRGVVADEARLQRFYRFMEPTRLVVGGKVQPNWLRDGASFWYADRVPHDTVILRVDGRSGATAPLFDVSKTRAALAAHLGRELPYRGLPFDFIIELDGCRYQFTFEGVDYVLSTDCYSVVEAARSMSAVSPFIRTVSRMRGIDPAARQTPRMYRRPMWMIEPPLVTETPSPDRRWFASLQEGNVVLRAPVDDRTVPLTTDGTPEFAWDIEAPRFKYTAGLELSQHVLQPWSPDGCRLFAIKVDRRSVADAALIRYLKRDEEVCTYKLQRAGAAIDIAHPHVIDVLSKRAVRLDLGATEDQFFTLIGWLPDGSEVLFTRHSRDFKTVDVLAGNPVSGAVRVVFAERAETFVAIQHDVISHGDNHVTMVPDGSGLIWRSARSGWNHLYHYGIDGRLHRALTAGEFAVMDVVSIDSKAGWIYFTAHHDAQRPYDTHLCRVRLTGGAIQRLTPMDGQNEVNISPGHRTFTVVNSRVDRPYRTDFHTCDGRHLATVQQADVTELEALGHISSEEFTVKADDGQTTLWGVMHKPADFDPGKKYPVIDHLYCGPQVTMVAHHFGLGENSHSRLDRALAQLGYIVISVDARGTPERSKAFHDVVYRSWGRHEIPDHVAALRELAQRHPYIDLERAGVWGHSWGGHFAIRALAQAPEVFRVGLAVAPGVDPYDRILFEPYLDLPTRAKAAYDFASLYSWAERIRGRLMLLVGTSDAPSYSNSVKMVHALVQAGIDHEFVMLPEASHYFYGKDEEYFVHKLVEHFETHLKAAEVVRASLLSPSASRRLAATAAENLP